MRLQRPGGNMARHTPLREGRRTRSQLPRCLHQSRERPQGSTDLRSVRYFSSLICLECQGRMVAFMKLAYEIETNIYFTLGNFPLIRVYLM